MCDTLTFTMDVPVNSAKCEKCGQEYKTGEWPYCPHGTPRGMLGEFRPYIEYNITHEPVEIRSLADRNRLMKQHNHEHRSPKMGNPGCEF